MSTKDKAKAFMFVTVGLAMLVVVCAIIQDMTRSHNLPEWSQAEIAIRSGVINDDGVPGESRDLERYEPVQLYMIGSIRYRPPKLHPHDHLGDRDIC